MTHSDPIIAWLCVLFVVIGLFLAFLQMRKWYDNRTFGETVLSKGRKS